MATATGLNLLCALCDALGIDHKNRPVTGLTIVANVDEVARVEVREVAMTPTGDGSAKFAAVVKQYTLAPIPVITGHHTVWPDVPPAIPHVVSGS